MSAATAGFPGAGPSRAPHLDYRSAAPMPPPVQATAPPPVSTKSPRKKAAAMKSNKPQMPEFPPVVVDDEGVEWGRVQLLGQGGFARVFAVVGPDGNHKAFKCISKKAIENSKKNRQKLLAEIMIHKSLSHPNIVQFEDTFEDTNNVYFKLELCHNGSMNDILKRRGAYTEPEARFFMVQILAGCQNMHINSVIHRDLKLGNIFLDQRMNVKIGDFGLAALLKYPEERKKTMCGTPNYIAPEIIEDPNHEGHSFEVDVWSVGVILYTLLVGKPPFQTSHVTGIYDKIKTNDYQIPREAHVSSQGRDLITRILAHKPSERPTLCEIMAHPWFRSGPVPKRVPQSACTATPLDIVLPKTERDSQANFELLKRNAGFRDDADDALPDDEEAAAATRKKSAREERREQEKVEEDRERMNQAAHKAVQPGSPISALLRAGRQPLVKVPQSSAGARPVGPTSLARQLSALNIGRATAAQVSDKAGSAGGAAQPEARVVYDKENAGPGSMPPPASTRTRSAREDVMGADERRLIGQKANVIAGMTKSGSVASLAGTVASSADEGEGPRQPRQRKATVSSSFETLTTNLGNAFQCIADEVDFVPVDANGQPIVLPTRLTEGAEPDSFREAEPPRTFLLSWLDHSERYGLGYAMTDGSMGVSFRDSTSMVFNAQRSHADYISTLRARATPASAAPAAQLRRENFILPRDKEDAEATVPKDLSPKMRVMRFFEDEIMERLYGADNPLTWLDEETTTGMTFVHKWYRCQQAIIFRLSNSIIQFNFYDHIKLILSSDGLVVSVIDVLERTGGVPTMKSYRLQDLVSIAHPDRAQREADALAAAQATGQPCEIGLTRPSDRKFVRGLLRKVKYAREVLVSSGQGLAGRKQGASIPTPPDTMSRATSAESIASANSAAAQGEPTRRR